jgi:ADP-heptose:LPS heptosyltransferase
MDKIIFFHMNQLGDLLFSLPVLAAAKKESGAKIVSVVKSSLSPLLSSCALADEIIPKEKHLIKLVKSLRREKSGKAVLFSESPSSVLSAYFSAIKERTGFETASLAFLLTNKAERKGVPSLANNMELGRTAGFQNIQKDYTGILKIPEKNAHNAQKWFEENKLNPSKTIAISPGASKKRKDKQLEPYIWAQITDGLRDKGFSPVLSGAAWEKNDLNAIAGICKNAPKLFTAENGILDSAAFLKACGLFIGIDSGAMHLAAAFGTKCIAIFGHTDPLQTGPMPLENHIIIKKDNMSNITPQDIISKV